MKIPLLGFRWAQSESNPDIFGLIPSSRMSRMQWARENFQTIKTDKRLIDELESIHKERYISCALMMLCMVFLELLPKALKWVGVGYSLMGEEIINVFSIIYFVIGWFYLFGFGYHFLASLMPQCFGIDDVLSEIEPTLLWSLYDTYAVKPDETIPAVDDVSCGEDVIQALLDSETTYVDG